MYASRKRISTAEYPYGAYCECGRIIHLKENELCIGLNKIKCPVCGCEVGLVHTKEYFTIEGYVTEADLCHKRITYVKPVKHCYSYNDEVPTFKYSCPVCDCLGNRHQVLPGDKNCRLCNVNLIWE